MRTTLDIDEDVLLAAKEIALPDDRRIPVDAVVGGRLEVVPA